MKTSDIVKLLCSPFRKRTLTRKPELPAWMIDSGLAEPDRRTVSATGWPQRLVEIETMKLRNVSLPKGQNSSA
jgi:hypothetical protein